MKNFPMNKNLILRMFITILLSIFFVEFTLMYALGFLINMTLFWESFLDATLLSIILSIVLYFAYSRPLVNEIYRRTGVEQKFKYLFKNSTDAIMALNPPDWKFSDGNDATLAIYGLKNMDEFKNITPVDVSPEYQPDGQLSSKKAKEMIGIAMDKGSNSFDWTHKKLNGKEFFARVTLTRIEVGNDIFLQAVVRDVTKEKEAILNLEQLQAKTKEALDNSERVNKLMVGRELKMINLKKKIAESENNIKQ